MWRILQIVSLSLFLILSSTGCEFSSPKLKIYTVGIVSIDDNFNPFVENFKTGMAKAGYVEGKTIHYLYDGPIKKEQLADRLVFLKNQHLDLLFTLSTPVSQKAKEVFADTKVPILFCPVYDPVTSGLVDSLTNPGGNITGVMVGGSLGKALGYLLDVLPGLKTIFVPFPQKDSSARANVGDLKTAAAKYGIRIVPGQIDNRQDLASLMENIPADADAVWLPNSPLIVSNASMIIQAAMKRGLPVSSTTSKAQDGALLSYGVAPQKIGIQLSALADKLLKGVPASQLPVERAEYILAVNLQTAQRLGINVQESLLKQADIIIR
ncbi:MAG: ABC transporter substrate-binding protein [Desulfobulbaceae bacterium]|nr:ABC transporter substrate-binding protein [Desulfobulbaceae bacterium]HIJ90977.1 ABC transporter substrate-binding protein [Deltaproteobacteria bacterium]